MKKNYVTLTGVRSQKSGILERAAQVAQPLFTRKPAADFSTRCMVPFKWARFRFPSPAFRHPQTGNPVINDMNLVVPQLILDLRPAAFRDTEHNTSPASGATHLC